MSFYVYVLLNPTDQIYIGQTDELTKRHSQHNDPDNDLSRYTKRYPGPWRLIHAESFETRRKAILRERELKSGKGREWIRSVLVPFAKAGGC